MLSVLSVLGADVLDGNAIGELLIEVFGTEMTTATGTCDNCGTVSQVAEMPVYLHGLGPVVRCPAAAVSSWSSSRSAASPVSTCKAWLA
jgi:hypothetical protein